MKETKGKMDMEYDDTLVLGGQVMPNLIPDGGTNEERIANHKRIMKLWNAAEGMDIETAEAVLVDYQKRWK